MFVIARPQAVAIYGGIPPKPWIDALAVTARSEATRQSQ